MKKPAYEVVDDDDDDVADHASDDRRWTRKAFGVLKWLSVFLATGCMMLSAVQVFGSSLLKADGEVYHEIQIHTTFTHAYAVCLPAVVWMLAAGFFQREEHRRD